MVWTLAFVLRIIRLLFFSTAKNVNFPQTRTFSKVIRTFAIKEIFESHGNFPQSWKCSTNKKVFHKKKSYLIKKVFRKKIFSLIIEIFHKGRKFPQTRCFLDQGYFPQTKPFIKSKEFSANKFQKDSLKAKILDPFNTQSYVEKI